MVETRQVSTNHNHNHNHNHKSIRKIPNGNLANLTTDIHRVVKELGRRPTSDDYVTYGRYYLNAVYRAFGKEWDDVLAFLGYKTPKKTYSYQDIVEELDRVSKKLAKLPTVDEYNQLSKIKHDRVMEVTKLSNWIEVLAVAFNITKEKVDEVVNPKHPFYQEQFVKLKTIAEKLHRIPTMEESSKYGVNADLLIKRLNISWLDILVLANIINIQTQANLTNLPYRVVRVGEMLDDLNNLARELGHYPTSLKYDQLGSFSSNLLMYRLNVNWIGVIDLAKNRERVFGNNKTVIKDKTCIYKTVLDYFDVEYKRQILGNMYRNKRK